MNRILAIALLVLALGACTPGSATPVDYSKPDTVITAELPSRDLAWETQWNNEVWVFPASIQIGHVDPSQVRQHYQAGVKIVYPIVLHATAEPVQFHLTYQGLTADQITTTYVAAPAQASQWITFPDPNPLLAAYETREVPVEFFVPKNAAAPARWEFAVTVTWNQTGFFQQARAITFQINMKPTA